MSTTTMSQTGHREEPTLPENTMISLDDAVPVIEDGHAPRNWPTDITYTARPVYARDISPAILQALHTPPTSSSTSSSVARSTDTTVITPSSSLPASPNSNVIIRPIHDSRHPANGQHGLFAVKDIAPDTLMCIYTGYVYGSLPDATTSDSKPDVNTSKQNKEVRAQNSPISNYDLSLARGLTTNADVDPNTESGVNISIDAANIGNEARFVNDYRGVPLTSSASSVSLSSRDHSRSKSRSQLSHPRQQDSSRESGPNVEFRELWIQWSRKDREAHRVQTMASATSSVPGDGIGASDGADADVQDTTGQQANDVSQASIWSGKFERCMGLYVLSAGKKSGTRRSRGILAGEELLVSYGKGFWKGNDSN